MEEPTLHVVLVQPLIPPNTGNVARLCAATGCALHLVEPLGFSLADRQLKRAGLDYWEHVAVKVWRDFPALQRALGNRPFHFFSARVRRPYTRAPYAVGDALVFGNEEDGLPDALLLEHAGAAYTIPMWGAVRSLNLSTSAGIVVYEALRVIHGF
jgi:tRNA (cytidine/uridine-2'-O-)-methyltransferase